VKSAETQRKEKRLTPSLRILPRSVGQRLWSLCQEGKDGVE
jgi:hypothetical protein